MVASDDEREESPEVAESQQPIGEDGAAESQERTASPEPEAEFQASLAATHDDEETTQSQRASAANAAAEPGMQRSPTPGALPEIHVSESPAPEPSQEDGIANDGASTADPRASVAPEEHSSPAPRPTEDADSNVEAAAAHEDARDKQPTVEDDPDDPAFEFTHRAEPSPPPQATSTPAHAETAPQHEEDDDPLGVNQIDDVVMRNAFDVGRGFQGGEPDVDIDFLMNAYSAYIDNPDCPEANGVVPNEPDGDMDMDDIGQQVLEQEQAEDEHKRLEGEYSRKKKRGRNTFEDDVAHLQREQQSKKRMLMMQPTVEDYDSDAPDDDAEGEGVFVPMIHEDDIQDPIVVDDSMDEDAGRPKRRGKASKAKPAKAPSKKAKGGRGKKPLQQQAPRGKRQTKQQQQAQNNLMNADSLGTTNVFAAAQMNKGRAEQPLLGASKNKDTAMKELIASIPEEALSTAKIDKNLLAIASRKFGRPGMCAVDDGQWRVKGTKSLLSHYQMMGSSFMCEREATDQETNRPLNKPPGGLQCDAMGLGKTVMSIATIMADRFIQLRQPGKKRTKSVAGLNTLIVAPASILHQWRDEIRKHADEAYSGSSTIYTSSTNEDEFGLSQHGVVLTTYQQVQKSYPKKEYPPGLVTADAKESWWNEYFDEHKGLLHTIKWRRVILDEATAIKNWKSRTSAACAELPGQFRWILTGTPAMNSLDEFYAYFRFLRVPNTTSFKLFKQNFLDDVDGKDRLIAYLRPLMLRRTHHHTLFGSKLLNLPEPTQDTYRVTLDPLHWEVYKIVKERFVENINIIARRGDLKAKYSSVLTLLLRLRQFVAHPLLIQDSIRDLLEDSDFEKIKDKLDELEDRRDTDEHQKQIVQHLRLMLANKDTLSVLEPLTPMRSPFRNSQQDSQGERASSQQPTEIDLTGEESSQPAANGSTAERIGGGDNAAGPAPKQADPKGKGKAANAGLGAAFGLRDDFFKFISELRQEGKVREVGERITCARCNQIPQRPTVTSCQHTYCFDCQVADTQEAAERGKINKCKRCGLPYTGTERYRFDEWERGDMPKQAPQNSLTGHFKKPKPKDIVNQWIDTNGNMLPSAKTQAFKAQVLNWFEENPKVKIIVYTQFITMMEILAKICEIEGWSYLKYHGGMSTHARNVTVGKFEKESFNIFFATLTTGGVGLNLTMATRVLMIDPWWNQAVEQQAFCRTYRRGQEQKTGMMRFAARDTVDEHILKLQERKEKEITSVMGEEQIKKQLGMGDLIRLFGPVGEDETGEAFIYPEQSQRRGPARWVATDETEAMADATDQ